MYTLLTGHKLKREKEVIEEQIEDIDGVSDACKQFLTKVLSENPEERPSIEELREHLW